MRMKRCRRSRAATNKDNVMLPTGRFGCIIVFDSPSFRRDRRPQIKNKRGRDFIFGWLPKSVIRARIARRARSRKFIRR
eukprot:scaffold187882_cov50-Attheya_sp.AAC.4